MTEQLEQYDDHGLPEPKLVEDFQDSYSGSPQNYPGERPETSYVTDGTHVFAMKAEWSEDGQPSILVRDENGVRNIDELLADAGVPPMADRYPIVAFGANVSPGALKQKYTVKEDGEPVREDLQIVPTLYGDMPGYDVVWSHRPGQKGNFLANLYTGEETTDTTIKVGINFLTAEQMLIMHSGEGAYDVAQFGAVDIDETHKLPAIFYAGKSGIFLEDGHPVAVEAVGAEGRTLPASTSGQMLEQTLSHPSVREALQANVTRFTEEEPTVDTYTDEALNRKLSERKEMQAVVSDALGEMGLQGSVDVKARLENVHLLSRANPDQLPTLRDMLDGLTAQGSKAVVDEGEPVFIGRLPEQHLNQDMGKRREKIMKQLRKQIVSNEILDAEEQAAE